MTSISLDKQNCAWLRSGVSRKLTLWLVLSILLPLLLLNELRTNLLEILSPDWILLQYHVSPWGVLALCLVFLWVKRKQVWQKMEKAPANQVTHSRGIQFLLGACLVAAAILIPYAVDYLIFRILLISLGVFIALFGEAARLPTILLAIYGFAISFPLFIRQFAEDPYAMTSLGPVMWLMNLLGYPIQNQGQWINFTSVTGEAIKVVVTVDCAGPATMGVFIAIFALMMMDTPLPPGKATKLFLFGIVGTWFQNLLRLVILLLFGYYLGKEALLTAHFWTIYIIFPIWYLLFVYIYFKIRKPVEQAGTMPVMET